MIKIDQVIFYIVTIFIVTMFFSCNNNNLKEVQKIGIASTGPLTMAKNIITKHTDSGKLIAILESPKMLDFSNREFSFTEFPEGINFTHIDTKGNHNNVVADYAIIYDDTNLIDLRGNVVVTTHDGNILKTNHLYYDKKLEWFFSNQTVTINAPSYFFQSNIFSADKDFKSWSMMEASDSKISTEE